MQLSNALVVAQREYLARIKSKAFWIATLIMPLIMGAWIFLPSLLADRASARQRLVVVGGNAELFAAIVDKLENDVAEDDVRIQFDLSHDLGFVDNDALRSGLDERVRAKEIDAWLWLGDDPLTTETIEYHAESTSNILTQRVLRNAISRVLREQRLVAAGYEPEAVADLNRSVDLEPFQIGADGERGGSGQGAFLLAVFVIMSLYMGIVMYGQAVMNGVLEEKSSRVVEVLLATITPSEMMLGKLAGICGAALTQLAVWLGTAAVITTPGLVAAQAMLPDGLPTVPIPVIVHFFAFFLLGFGIYAAFYAALGAAFNNVQEAQQMSFLGVSFLIAPLMFMLPVINDPDSKLAVVSSLIPMFTPLVMMLRIAVKMPPTWQIALAYVLTTAFMLFMVWMAARIYRTGILMYGKKPTFAELWRWLRHA